MKIEFEFEYNDKLGFSQKNKLKKIVKNVVEAVNDSKYIKLIPELDHFKKASYVAVTFTDDESIRTINRENRDIDKATDVLSFPYLDFFNGEYTASTDAVEITDNVIPFGDIIISIDTAYRQADEYGHSTDREIAFLTCHSMLHLYGYDHMTDEEFDVMNKITEEILTDIGYTRTGDK